MVNKERLIWYKNVGCCLLMPLPRDWRTREEVMDKMLEIIENGIWK